MDKNIIMIVDADPSWTRLLASSFGRRDYQVDTAGDAATALDLAARTLPPVMLVDPGMPGYQGLELVRQLRRASPQTRFIILTARASTETLLEAIRDHPFDFHCKPID